MSNPQINSLISKQTLVVIENNIISILSKYASKENPLCSHEILGLINYDTLIALAESIKSNSKGYSVPSSWIGSVAANLANAGRIEQVIKMCKYNKTDDEVWYIKL